MLFLCWWAALLPFPDQADIGLEIWSSPGYQGKVVLIAPHENERVVNGYVAEKVERLGGKFIILRQNGERHLQLKVGDRIFEVDPNRIFTPLGAKNTLLSLNPTLSEETAEFKTALDRAIKLGRFICQRLGGLDKHSIIVAIHNNTDGYDDDGKNGEGTVSIERYQKKWRAGAQYIKDVHRGSGDEDDLFFINRDVDFTAMKKAGWNVVLQHPRVAVLESEDDGSLSVYAEKIGARYINIEAQRKEGEDHLDVQKRMVDFIFETLVAELE